MVSCGVYICPNCGGHLHYYDTVSRIVRTKNGRIKRIEISRMRCGVCCRTHRTIPDYIIPFKHYERDIIEGFVDGLIDSSTFGFEDSPCESTITRWITRKKQDLL